MKTIFITLAKDIIARNIFYTDFWKIFKERNSQNRIVLIVEPDKVAIFARDFGGGNVIVEGFKRGKPTKAESLVMSLARSAINTHTNTWSKMRSYRRGDSGFLATYLKLLQQKTLGNFGWYKKLLRLLILKTGQEVFLEKLFNKYSPNFVIGTSITDYDFEVLIMREAKKRQIKTIGLLRSWDNLSSHGLLRVVPDIFLLQNTFLKEMALEHQAIDESDTKISLFGVPHYDVLHPSKLKMAKSRSDFFRDKGLDPDKKLLFYGAMGEFLFIHENELPGVFEEILRELGEGYQLLYRTHPKFPVKKDLKNYPSIIFDQKGDYVKEGSGEDESGLVESLYYSDVIITGASTIAIDGAVLGKPIICVAFDGVISGAEVNYWESVKRFYDRYTHFEELVKTGGVKVAYGQTELKQDIEAYIENPRLHAHGRKKIIERMVAPFDGEAGLRLANLIQKEL